MKKITLTLLCLLLVLIGYGQNAVPESAKVYRLVQAQVSDEVPLHGPVDSATVYVLLCPDQRLYVFRAFHSHPMEEVIKHFPRGSTLRYDANALAAAPPEAQVQALKAFCRSKGIELVFTETN